MAGNLTSQSRSVPWGLARLVQKLEMAGLFGGAPLGMLSAGSVGGELRYSHMLIGLCRLRRSFPFSPSRIERIFHCENFTWHTCRI
jgi:hypothetical protein